MRLKEKYQKEVAPALQKEFSIPNVMLIPKLEKVVINVGTGRHIKDKEYMNRITAVLEKISGQKPILCKARKSISAFKVRQGMTVGIKVTLRGKRMYDFTEKLVNITLPRVHDFRGLKTKSIDPLGNLSLGFKDQSAFPEVSVEDLDHTFGLELSFATSAKNKEQGLALFTLLGFPFQKEANKLTK